MDFKTNKLGEPHYAVLVQIVSEDPEIFDAGPVSEAANLLTALNGDADREAAAALLYAKLLGWADKKLAELKTVYVAPDGKLNLVPFAQLKLPDGRYWEERQEVRLLNSGRDLLRIPSSQQQARGLIAFGGIDFGETGRFEPRPQSREEVERVAAVYEGLRRGEPVEIWTGKDASEARLKERRPPPRVLHLATHGFYERKGAHDQPLVLSGIALAGANKVGAAGGEDGVLHGLEVQDLDLDGTELVVLSACETARGFIDYGEGVYGLARALRIAGARHVLLTLWPVDDVEARDFMFAFYRNWLSQRGQSDPAAALRQTRLDYIKSPDLRLREPDVWAPYVLIGG